MEKRVLLATVLCMGILFLWMKLYPQQQPPAPASAPASVAPTPDASKAAAPAPGTVAAAPAAGAPIARAPEQFVKLETTEATFTFSTWGGGLRQVTLKGETYHDRAGQPLSLVHTTTAEQTPLRMTFPRADFAWPEAVAWQVSRPAADTVSFVAETDAVRIERRFQAGPQRFRLRHEVTIENKTDKSQAHGLAMYLYGVQDPGQAGGGIFGYASANMAEMVCHVNGSVERGTVESLAKKPADHSGTVRWIAADEKFFGVALVPPPDATSDRRCGSRALDGVTGEVFVSLGARTLAPGGRTSYAFEVFAGPKVRADLEAIKPGGEDVELSRLVNVTFAPLSRPMLALLVFFHGIVGNWGLAIIMLTICVRLVTFYPSHRALMSGKRMARLSPKLAELRKKYEGDKERLAKETMNLYKSNGVNMFGGCLPSLIQMPIWIALFSTLNYAVELYHTKFFGYIRDLSAPDPYYLTPGIMGVIMFIQMRMSPAGADPQQQKIMSVMMPIMFTVFSLFLPSGLAIYTLTSYSIGILHQLFVNRLDKRAAAATAEAAA